MTIRFFFFFQAEDGIRDVAVTGVQTCALPIYQVQCLDCFPSLLIDGPAEFMDLTLTSSPLALVLMLASKGLVPYLRQHFLDKTFQGLYQVNAFDLALLIPYFIVLIVLAAYGAHRYWMVYL